MLQGRVPGDQPQAVEHGGWVDGRSEGIYCYLVSVLGPHKLFF